MTRFLKSFGNFTLQKNETTFLLVFKDKVVFRFDYYNTSIEKNDTHCTVKINFINSGDPKPKIRCHTTEIEGYS